MSSERYDGAGWSPVAVVEDDYDTDPPEDSPLDDDSAQAPAALALRGAGLAHAFRSAVAGAARAARPLAVICLFTLGIGGGILAYGALNPPAPPLPWPAIPGQPEPASAHQLAAAIASDDVSTVARVLDSTTLSALGDAMQPIVEVTDVKFVGAVTSGAEQYAAYVVHGRDGQGTDAIVGFVIHVSGNQVVGVNS